MLITFLTYKRGRVSLVLQSFEASVRILIKGVPVRPDLIWRADAIELPNRDLIESSEIKEIETLDWRKTYDFLCELYNVDNNKYRYNFCWLHLVVRCKRLEHGCSPGSTIRFVSLRWTLL